MNAAIMFYDFETNGLPDFKAPSEAKHQPHIVQAAAILVDVETRAQIGAVDVIVRPDGWTIPDSVAAIHGITTERATNIGISESDVVFALLDLWAGADCRVAHNEQFDARIMRIALKRFNAEAADTWTNGRAECTAMMSTPILAIPPTQKMIAAGRTHYKTANLTEAYKHFTGKDIENAHSAIADVNACIAVYWAIRDKRDAAILAG